MKTIATIEVTRATSKRGENYLALWVEAGDRAIYLSAPTADEAMDAARAAVVQLTGETGEFFFRDLPTSEPIALRVEVGIEPHLRVVAS